MTDTLETVYNTLIELGARSELARTVPAPARFFWETTPATPAHDRCTAIVEHADALAAAVLDHGMDSTEAMAAVVAYRADARVAS